MNPWKVAVQLIVAVVLIVYASGSGDFGGAPRDALWRGACVLLAIFTVGHRIREREALLASLLAVRKSLARVQVDFEEVVSGANPSGLFALKKAAAETLAELTSLPRDLSAVHELAAPALGSEALELLAVREAGPKATAGAEAFRARLHRLDEILYRAQHETLWKRLMRAMEAETSQKSKVKDGAKGSVGTA